MKLSDYLDPWALFLVCTVSFASLFPARGNLATLFQGLTIDAIALLFLCMALNFSVKPSWPAALIGACISGSSRHFAMTSLLRLLFIWWRSIPMSLGMCQSFLYRTILPAHVQISIAFTSQTGGNVAEAVCCASVVGHAPLSVAGVSVDAQDVWGLTWRMNSPNYSAAPKEPDE